MSEHNADEMGSSGKSTNIVPVNTILIEKGKDYHLKPGDELPYRVVRHLGYGHSGNVEEVEDIRTHAVYARKTIRIYGSRDNAERRRTFDNEIKIIRSLASHHHIIRIFATYIAKREVGLVLQPVADEGDLDAFLDRFREDAEESEATDRRILAHKTKTDILQRSFGCLASGLEFMHRLKIRHKDIKPRNILIHQGQVLYTDFGYSLDSSQSNRSTTAGKPSFWTRRYSAPELLDHEPRNSSSDIFSLGCVFIEILSVLEMHLDIGQDLCFGEDVDRVHRQIEKAKSNTPTGVLADLSEICIAMTHRNPSSRFTIAQVLAGMDRSSGYFCQQCLLAEKAPENQKATNFTPVVDSSTASALSNDLVLTGNSFKYDNGEVNESAWIWSHEQQDYYYLTRQSSVDLSLVQTLTEAYNDGLRITGIGISTYDTNVSKHQYSNMATGVGSSMKIVHLDKINTADVSSVSVFAEPRTMPTMIHGKPESGWYESLDNSYRMRTGIEAHHFFKVGKVFSILYTQTSTDLAGPGNDNFTTVKYGELVYTQIRRFVVVMRKRGFVYACPISTYSGRGTLKHGVLSQEHSVVYLVGTEPTQLHGEYLTKDPIGVIPAEAHIKLSAASRLCFGKMYPIEMNVKAKDIGNVRPEDLTKLLMYYRSENDGME